MKYLNEETYVDKAEEVIKKLKDRKDPRTGKTIPMVTTSKLRNLLAMTTDIYNEVATSRNIEISDECKQRIDYLRIRFVYEAGRDEKGVKPLVEESGILDILKEIGKSRDNYILFNRYMESLVAFHKFYGGKDN